MTAAAAVPGMSLLVLDAWDLGLVLRTTGAILLIGRGAREGLREASVHVVTRRPSTSLALLGVPADGATKLPSLPTDGLATTFAGRDWYLVNETEVRDAYGVRPDLAAPGDADDPTLLAGQTTVSAIETPRQTRYFEDAD